jgi:hypothetical protein
MESDTKSRPNHLRVASSSTGVAERHDHIPISLTAAPFRPGELPVTSWLVLDIATRDLIANSALSARVPAELWVRVAVESSRLVTEIASEVSQPEPQVSACLDAAACASDGLADPTLGTAALDRYADHLATAHASGRVPVELPLRLPEEMAGAWQRDAARERVSMPRWVGARLRAAPAACVNWEIAAARASQSLGEWAYASFLRASTSSIA